MKLSDLHALPLGAPLLLDPPPPEPVLYAGLDSGSGRRTRVRVVDALGDERHVQTRLLTPGRPAPHPDVVMVRPGLTGHTMTVERITAVTWSRLGVRRGVVGDLAVIERQDGRFGTVRALHADLWGGSIEQAARSYADSLGAVYVPGSAA